MLSYRRNEKKKNIEETAWEAEITMNTQPYLQNQNVETDELIVYCYLVHFNFYSNIYILSSKSVPFFLQVQAK